MSRGERHVIDACRRLQADGRQEQHPATPAGDPPLAGLIAVKEKRWDDAIAELLKTNPRNCTVLIGLGDAWLAKGDKEKARQQFTRAANFNELDLEFAAVRSVAQQKLAALK
jgi:predicted negative regulator of RcsB-dependent stress response